VLACVKILCVCFVVGNAHCGDLAESSVSNILGTRDVR
jgi:hypothetical protein